MNAAGQPTRVIFNDRVLFRTMTGVGNYSRQLLAALAEHSSEFVMNPYLSTRFKRKEKTGQRGAGNGGKSRAGLSLARPLIQGGLALLFRWDARGHGLYHEPNHVPLRSTLPTVTTVHDISVLEHPEWHPADRVRWYERDFSRGAARTTRFIAASEYTKSRMAELLGIAADRIDVTYQAPRAAFVPQSLEVIQRVLSERRLPPRFFLFVGTLEPRKNVAGLLKAFTALPQNVRETCPLVLIGGAGWQLNRVGVDLDELKRRGDIHWLGYLDNEQALAALYSAAAALVWPTWYEGFGLPPLEAMACGCPVIVSNTTSLPEVVGEVGCSLAPEDDDGWIAAMQRAAEDADWRELARTAGLARAATFSWQRCAAETVACYRKALEAAH